jgi:hypothetical protein
MAVRLSALRARGYLSPPPPRKIPDTDPRVIVRLEGLDQLKNPMDSSGIEPATFPLVA